jgi:prepilin-type N-terminal cleavage/methylation domain-containing protein
VTSVDRAPSNRRTGFTLVELLVVIGIIALLIAVLLPALNAARRQARTAKCSANVRSILQAMQMYVSESKGWVPASGWTSGRAAASPAGNANLGGINHLNDWQAPLGQLLGIPFNTGNTITDRTERFHTLNAYEPFVCPENDIKVMSQLTGSAWVGQEGYLNSYLVAVNFMFRNWPAAPANSGTRELAEMHARNACNVPGDYTPKLNKIGSNAEKIFIACGGAWIDTNGPQLRMTLRLNDGGIFGDPGGWAGGSSVTSHGFARQNAPGNGGGTDFRIFTFRHGKRVQGAAADTMRTVVGFYDGHAEVMGDLQSSNPALWNPRGTSVAHSDVVADVKTTFLNGKPNPYVVP